jgi:hypothetical protein
MAAEQPDEVVRLASARNSFEAHEWEQALREEDIYCKVVGDYLEAGIGDISGLLPEIWVRQEELARAQKVLQRLEKAVKKQQSNEEE